MHLVPFFYLEKFWFCRLSLNHKVLHYGDLDESPQGEVPFELLSDKSKTLQWFHLPDNKSVITQTMTLSPAEHAASVTRLTLIGEYDYVFVSSVFPQSPSLILSLW